MGKLAIISEETVRKIVTRQLAFDAVRAAFEAVAVDRSRVFDVVIGTGLHNGEAFAIKSGIDAENEMVGFKCGTYWAGNFDKGLPAHGSTILLLDPETGFPTSFNKRILSKRLQDCCRERNCSLQSGSFRRSGVGRHRCRPSGRAGNSGSGRSQGAFFDQNFHTI